MVKDKSTSVYFDRDKLRFVGLKKAVIDQLKNAYKGVDIDAELSKMSLWLNSAKGKNRVGNISFIMNWLSRAKPAEKKPEEFPAEESPLDPYFAEYQQDLWKGKEHILEMNKKKI